MIVAYFIFLKNFPFQFGIKQAGKFFSVPHNQIFDSGVVQFIDQGCLFIDHAGDENQVISAIVRLCSFGVNEAEVKVQTVT